MFVYKLGIWRARPLSSNHTCFYSISVRAVWEGKRVSGFWQWRRGQRRVCEPQIKTLLELALMNCWHHHTHIPTMEHKNTDTKSGQFLHALDLRDTSQPTCPTSLTEKSIYPHFISPLPFYTAFISFVWGLGALYQHCVLNTWVDLAVSRWQ